MPEGIKTRIRIRTEQEVDIAYIYDIDQIRLLVPERGKDRLDETFLNSLEGSIITIEGGKWKIVEVLTKFCNITFDDDGKGINMFGVGETLPFNFQVTYVVRKA